MYKKYSSIENSAYGFERALAFVTIHPWEIVMGNWPMRAHAFTFVMFTYKCVYLYDISAR